MSIIVRNYAIKIDRFLSDVDEITDNECFYNRKENLMCGIIDAVHAIADCYERNKTKLYGEDKELVLAFGYLNNQLKHDKDLEVFSSPIYSAVLPTRFPFRLGATSCSMTWADFEDHGQSRIATRDHYDKYLKQKDVAETLSEVKRALDGVVNM